MNLPVEQCCQHVYGILVGKFSSAGNISASAPFFWGYKRVFQKADAFLILKSKKTLVQIIIIFSQRS